MGRGGHVFRQVLGGSDVFHWSFFSLKGIASGGLRPPDPLYPSSIMWDFLNHWATLEIKYALFLLNKNLFLQMSPSSFTAFNNNHYHQLHSISRSSSLCLTWIYVCSLRQCLWWFQLLQHQTSFGSLGQSTQTPLKYSHSSWDGAQK